MMKGANLRDEQHVVRVVTFAKLRLNEHSEPVGVNYTALMRREHEDGLSVTALEYFEGPRDVQIVAAVHALRASNFKPTPKGGFAIANVAEIHNTCAARNSKVRIIHWPVDDNNAHCDIRQLPRDDVELLERLATVVFAELHMNSNFPAGDAPAPPKPATTPWP